MRKFPAKSSLPDIAPFFHHCLFSSLEVVRLHQMSGIFKRKNLRRGSSPFSLYYQAIHSLYCRPPYCWGKEQNTNPNNYLYQTKSITFLLDYSWGEVIFIQTVFFSQSLALHLQPPTVTCASDSCGRPLLKIWYYIKLTYYIKIHICSETICLDLDFEINESWFWNQWLFTHSLS